jgi:hypothetical protein
MNTLLHLPYEIVQYILIFVENKIYISMTCKAVREIIHNIFSCKQLINYNDPYYVSKYYNADNILTLKTHIHKITNHKILNYICECLKGSTIHCEEHQSCSIELLQHYNRTNNNLNPENVYALISYTSSFTHEKLYFVKTIFNHAIKIKSYNFALLLLLYNGNMISLYLNFIYNNQNNDEYIDGILESIDFFASKYIISFLEVYRNAIPCTSVNYTSKVIEYLKTKIDPYIMGRIQLF